MSMMSIFRIFSAVFDPSYLDSDIILDYTKELTNFKQCLTKLNQ